MLDVGDAPREVRAAVLALRRADRDLRSKINRATRETLSPVWRGLVQNNAYRRRDGAILAKGARIKAGNPPAGIAASSRRPLSGGLVPGDQWAPFEFGGDRSKVTTYTRLSPRGRSHQVRRHTARQLPPRSRQGHVVYPAVAEIAPRAASLWVQLIVRAYLDAAEETN